MRRSPSSREEAPRPTLRAGLRPAAMTDGDDPLIGTRLNDTYELLEVVGRGGMGMVYEAIQHPLGRRVAVKVMLPREGDRARVAAARFFREAKACSHLTHPHTVTVHDFGETDDGCLFLAMELLKGRTLLYEMEHQGALDLVWSARMAEQVAGSLMEAHSHGIIHRDLKPSNIFLCQLPGHLDFVKVLDFGLAKAFSDQLALADVTAEDVVVGTRGYLAPEQIRCDVLDHRTDVWALGVVLYRCATGRLPFVGERAEVVTRTMTRPPPPPSMLRKELPEEAERVLMWALEKEPAARPESVLVLARSWAEALDAPFTMQSAGFSTIPQGRQHIDTGEGHLSPSQEDTVAVGRPSKMDFPAVDSASATATEPTPEPKGKKTTFHREPTPSTSEKAWFLWMAGFTAAAGTAWLLWALLGAA